MFFLWHDSDAFISALAACWASDCQHSRSESTVVTVKQLPTKVSSAGCMSAEAVENHILQTPTWVGRSVLQPALLMGSGARYQLMGMRSAVVCLQTQIPLEAVPENVLESEETGIVLMVSPEYIAWQQQQLCVLQVVTD